MYLNRLMIATDINLVCYNLVTILVKKVLKYMYPTFYRIFPGERERKRERDIRIH